MLGSVKDELVTLEACSHGPVSFSLMRRKAANHILNPEVSMVNQPWMMSCALPRLQVA